MTGVASEYGGAIFALAREDGVCPEIAASLAAVKASLTPEYLCLLSSPAILLRERIAAVEAAFGALHPHAVHFVSMMVERGYASEIIPSIAEFERLDREARGVSIAEIVSAAPLNEDERERLISALESRYSRKLEASFALDPTLLGGIRVSLDGRMLDSTLRRRLDRIARGLAGLTLSGSRE